ncbi:citrulline utilization hydrolase CtlX [Flavobacterium pallidum]|uniref:Amidinotransferase n=1 Tax=Flavobacterium pallidum TaxID=2172098 RepID=A0A2S1SDL8_9FLAO|nr:arginine deiminase-related protein [Flavobacterium pallidum]AWI24479.1 amidinotransferase [Flavobacterium pallidum]
MHQSTNTLLMIRPVSFRMNPQTTIDNAFQKGMGGMLPAAINAKAQQEFDALVDVLKKAGVEVIVIDDTEKPDTPDSIFPNNWVSFHENGDVALYPMRAENRRPERREDILDILEGKGFLIENVMDYTDAETDGYFLEGTGSVVLDRVNGKAYCCLSERSNEELFIEFCEDFDLHPVIFEAFHANNNKRKPIYHTNVMLCIGSKFAVIFADAIDDKKERKMVLDSLKDDGKEIIFITESQLDAFAGNMLEVLGSDDKKLVLMSAAAKESLTEDQINKLQKHAEILSSDLKTIEACGGGSVRCMIAEVFLPHTK